MADFLVDIAGRDHVDRWIQRVTGEEARAGANTEKENALVVARRCGFMVTRPMDLAGQHLADEPLIESNATSAPMP
jgi:hypothetical protein